MNGEAPRALFAEGLRYVAAGAVALAFDFGLYVALIRGFGVHYLVAAPAGFLLGLAVIYLLSVRWIFRRRRLADARKEFALFAAIGVVGVGLNQLVVYGGVEALSLSFELAKLLSAASVFLFNFAARKALLFTVR